MSDKEIAKRMIDELSEEATLAEIIQALRIRAKFERGEEQIRAGHGIPHAEVKQRLRRWLS